MQSRSLSPSTLSDASDQIAGGGGRLAQVVYRRLAEDAATPHVTFPAAAQQQKQHSPAMKIPTAAAAQGGGETLSKSQLVLEDVKRLLELPRSQKGFAGRLRFQDLDQLLSYFRVDVFSTDTMDEVWATMCDRLDSAHQHPPSTIANADVIATVLVAFGARPLKRHDSTAAARSTSPTISSARKGAAVSQRGDNVGRNKDRTPPARRTNPAPATSARRGTPTVFQRLVREAEVIRERHALVEQQRIEREVAATMAACSFVPEIHDLPRRASAASAGDPLRHKSPFWAATESSIRRAELHSGVGHAAAAPRDVEDRALPLPDNVSPCRRSASAWQRSSPSIVPVEVPLGFVEAVARIRNGVVQRSQRGPSFESSLRQSATSAHKAAELREQLANSTILRVAVPSLGEVVQVRLAGNDVNSPRRRHRSPTTERAKRQ